MKKIVFVFVFVFVNVTAAFAQVTYNEQYDTNRDGVVNVADVTAVVAYITDGGSNPVTPEPVSATMNKCDKPTWATSGDLYPYSMQMFFLNNSLPSGLTIARGDMIAAFIGNSCRAAAEPSYNNGSWHYNLSISGDDDDPTPANVVIRYYSAARGAYCESDPVTFQEGGILGSNVIGYDLSWK